MSMLLCFKPIFLRNRPSGCLALLALVVATSGSAKAGSIHPGFASAPAELVDQGELLLAELNCTSCHQADAPVTARLASKQGPVLGAQGIPLTAQYIRKFLSNPDGFKPGTTMPDTVH